MEMNSLLLEVVLSGTASLAAGKGTLVVALSSVHANVACEVA